MSKLAQDLIEGLTQALAYSRGDTTGCRVTIVDTAKKAVEIKTIRRRLRMSQERFSATYRIPLPTLKNWEQGRRIPDAPAAAYLYAIAKKPTEISSAFNE